MQKKLLAVAVAGALVAPAAMAQTSVTISGALNLWFESAGASGASNQATAAGTVGGDVKSRSRIQDGAGSNIRFTVVEDLGGGMQAFGQVESAVFNDAGGRANALNAGNGNPGAAGNNGWWGNRNSGVGLRGAAWGEVLLGVWDVHYNEQYAVDSTIVKGNSATSVLALMNNFGTTGVSPAASTPAIGGRYSNVLRYQSPSWSGFNFKVAYARPTDGAPPNLPGTAIHDKKNTVWSFAPQYSAGPIFVGWSYLRDKDLISATAPTMWSATAGGAVVTGVPAGTFTAGVVNDVTSNRLSGSYTFPMGIKLGLILDRSTWKFQGSGNTAAPVGSEIKRNVWAIPLVYSAGPHTVSFTYAKASKWTGNLGGADLSTITVTPQGGTAMTADSNTGAKFLHLGYMYDLSKRTTIHLAYQQITNDALAGYDFFANGVGMSGGTAAAAGVGQGAAFGADPKSYSIGLRHAF